MGSSSQVKPEGVADTSPRKCMHVTHFVVVVINPGKLWEQSEVFWVWRLEEIKYHLTPCIVPLPKFSEWVDASSKANLHLGNYENNL